MFTQCRGCGEIFKMSVDDLVTASAMVRCSSCGTVFNALESLSDYKPQHNSDLMLHENDNSPPLLTHDFKESILKAHLPQKPQVVAVQEDEMTSKPTPPEKITALEQTPNPKQEEIEEIIFDASPDFVDQANHSKNKKSSFLWVIFTLIGLGGLSWQASVAVQNGSLKIPEGKLKDQICLQIPCYSAVKQSTVNNIALVSRNIRQHPGRDNALIITMGIINSDSSVQIFPALQVKMSNLDGQTVAMRRFLPREYVDAETIEVGMMPNTLIPITLELQSPGKNAVTFEVGFSPTYGEE